VGRVARWGPVVFWHGRSSVLGAGVTPRGARRVALACLAVALFLPGLLPGYRSPGLVDVQGQGGPARVSINPIVDIRAQLLNNPDTEVMTVRTVPPVTSAPYWRFAIDDFFNGRQWLPAAARGSRGFVLDSGPVTLPRGLDANPAGALTLQQDFHFERLYLPQLPAAFEPISVELPTGGVQYNPDTGVLYDTNGTHP